MAPLDFGPLWLSLRVSLLATLLVARPVFPWPGCWRAAAFGAGNC
jgi:hypothetical protein